MNENAQEHEVLLPPEVVAERLGISLITARAWMRGGKLPNTVKIGKRGLLRIREADLNEYIRDLTTDRQPTP